MNERVRIRNNRSAQKVLRARANATLPGMLETDDSSGFAAHSEVPFG